MNADFDYITRAIPPDIYARAKATICAHIAIFEPEEYVVGKALCVDDYHFVLLWANGPMTLVDKVEYRPKKGDLVVFQPWEKVFVPGEGKAPGKFLHIAVKREFFQAVVGANFAFPRVQGRYSSQLLDLIGSFQLELMNYGDACPQMHLALSTQIVVQLMRDLRAEHVPSRDADNPYIREAIELMREHYATSISISDICALLYLSPSHFKRVFKEHTGRTPHQYLMNIRLEKAKELLSKKEASIEDTARLCGFVNPGHFAVAFKRGAGLSPSEYKKAHVRK